MSNMEKSKVFSARPTDSARLTGFTAWCDALISGEGLEGIASRGSLHPETFRYSLARTALGYQKDIENLAQFLSGDGACELPGAGMPLCVVLPANSLAPLLNCVSAGFLAGRPLLLKPSARNAEQTEALLNWSKRHLVDLDAAIVTEAPAGDTELIAFGNDETIKTLEVLQRSLRPGAKNAQFTGFGHAVSAGFLGREADLEDAAARTTRDIIPWDQFGCLSPGTVCVAGDAGRARDFAGVLAEHLDRGESKYPRGAVDPIVSLEIRTLRMDALLRDNGAVYASEEGTRWTVLFDKEGRIEDSPLGRTIWIRPVADWQSFCFGLEPVANRIAAVGIIDNEKSEIARAGGEFGSRITELGEMQSPPLLKHPECRKILTGGDQ